MIYVMSDIHGKYDEFMTMLKTIEFKETDTLYILGDVIDRGEEPIKCLKYIMHTPNIKMLLGNHEEFLLQALGHGDAEYYSCWMGNGGYITMNQFDELNYNQQQEILAYLKQLPLTYTIDTFEEDYILVHAGINFDNEGKQDREILLWARDEFIFSKNRYNGITVIFGHTPTYYMQKDVSPLTIWKGNGKIGIDCGACFEIGRLACLRLDDMKEFYV